MKRLIPILLLFAGQRYQSQTFKPGCDLPFQEIKLQHPIDKSCPASGTPTLKNTKANATQNKAKNNFCATGEPEKITIEGLTKLHDDVIASGMKFGNSNAVPEDRSGLQALGEGKVVIFTGFINKVGYANKSKGETVNCKTGGKEFNDIHMELTETRLEEDVCRRISAEISPHFRPKQWELEPLTNIKDGNVKVRITGQLFFDASHTACGSEGTGTRASSWEIHPVYRIQIFVNKKWEDLHEIEWEEAEE